MIYLDHVMDGNCAAAVGEAAKECVNDAGEWGRKIVEVYMSWYTFFGTTNLGALGWLFGAQLDTNSKRTLKPIVALFCLLNVVGTVTTVFVGWNVAPVIPRFSNLIYEAAIGNSIALLGFATVWVVCWKRKLN